MGYKALLTVVVRADVMTEQLDTAIALARREDAHLDILCLGIDRTLAGYYYVGAAPMAPLVLQETFDKTRDETLALEKAVRARMESEDIRWAIDTVISQVESIGSQIGATATYSDLVLLPKPFGAGAVPDEELIVEAALFDGEVPVLLLPEGQRDAAFGKRIVIGWNESDEAMRAVRAAMPYLKAAKHVDVAVVEPSRRGRDRSDPGGMLSQYLSRHGVRAEVSVLSLGGLRVADVLCRHAEEIGADLMVTGAYGHSRFREAILGGPTRDLFEIAKVPFLTAH